MMSCSIRSNSPGHDRRGFTLVELLVVIGIIAVLISILMPALGRARQQAVAVKCLSNLRQAGLALTQYVSDSKGRYPNSMVYLGGGVYAGKWWTALSRYTGKLNDNNNYVSGSVMSESKSILPTGIWACPSIAGQTFAGDTPNHYAANQNFFTANKFGSSGPALAQLPVTQVRDSSRKITIFEYNMANQDSRRYSPGNPPSGQTLDSGIPSDWDMDLYRNAPGAATEPRYRHLKRCNALFADGHAEALLKGTTRFGGQMTYRMFQVK